MLGNKSDKETELVSSSRGDAAKKEPVESITTRLKSKLNQYTVNHQYTSNHHNQSIISRDSVKPYENACIRFIVQAETYIRCKEKVKKQNEFAVDAHEGISPEEMEDMALGKLLVPEENMSILNFFAYLRNIRILNYLFEYFLENKMSLKVFPDATKRDLLDIAIDSNDVTLTSIITSNLAANPPKHNDWPSLNVKKIISLMNLKCNNIGILLDSRLIPIEPPNKEVLYTQRTDDTWVAYLKEPALSQTELVNIVDPADEDADEKKALMLYFADVQGIAGPNKSSNPEEEQFIQEHGSLIEFYDKILNLYHRDDDIFISKTLSAFINHKWFLYGRKVFFVDLLYAIILIAFYILIANILDYANRGDHSNIYNYVILIIGYLIILRELINELKSFLRVGFINGIKKYFVFEKNILDLFYIFSWTAFIVMNSIIVYEKKNIVDDENYFGWFFVVRSISNFALSLRVIWLFQINIQFGFMLRVIVFSTIKTIFFFLTFFLLIIAVTIGVGGLVYIKDDWGKAFSKWLEYFYFTYKLALGDFGDFFNLIEDDNSSIKSRAIYVYFGISTVILTIILLNLLITILGEAYGKVKEKETNYINSTTLSLISEIENSYKFQQIAQPNGVAQWIAYFLRQSLSILFLSKILVRFKPYGNYMILADASDDQYRRNFIDIKNLKYLYSAQFNLRTN